MVNSLPPKTIIVVTTTVLRLSLKKWLNNARIRILLALVHSDRHAWLYIVSMHSLPQAILMLCHHLWVRWLGNSLQLMNAYHCCFLQVYLLEACIFPLLYLAYITVVIFITYARVGCVACWTECCWQLTSVQNTVVRFHLFIQHTIHDTIVWCRSTWDGLNYLQLHMIHCSSYATSD